MLETSILAWRLTPDGEPITTATGTLLPVLAAGRPAMLKQFSDPEEAAGVALLKWWNGDGAVRILAEADEAILMERATGPASLTAMAHCGEDDRACRILCTTAARLHAARPSPLPALKPLPEHFKALMLDAARHPLVTSAAEVAAVLLASQREIRPLHGDLHHGNVLDFGMRGFLAIDPKGLYGERAFDFANIFCNPDIAWPHVEIARDPAIFETRLSLVSAKAGIERDRLLRWILAWCGLSAVWFMRDDSPRAKVPLAVGGMALDRIKI